MSKKIIATVSNNIATDQRLLKVGTTLKNNGLPFFLIGTKHRGSPSLSHIPFKTRRVSIIFKKNIWFYTELQFRLFFQLLKTNKQNAILLANDLDTLLPVYLISKMYGLPLVFDSHEIFSELPTLKEGSIQKRVWRFLEKRLIPKVDKMYTVSHSYATFFKEKYGKESVVISNFPLMNGLQNQSPSLQKADFKSQANRVVIYQGAINYSRGIDKMILAMEHLANTHLWIIGDGPMLETYRELSIQKKLTHKVKFLGKFTPSELKKITPLADLGLSLEEDNGLSYRFALPNKVFDFIHAGIPVLGSSDLPEVEAVIKKYGIGDVIENHDPSHIANKIEALLNQDKSIYEEGLKKAQKDLNWERQEEELLHIFRTVF